MPSSARATLLFDPRLDRSQLFPQTIGLTRHHEPQMACRLTAQDVEAARLYFL